MESLQAEDPDLATVMELSRDEFHAEYQQRTENNNPQPNIPRQLQPYQYALRLSVSWH
jgi:hypothetical protein